MDYTVPADSAYTFHIPAQPTALTLGLGGKMIVTLKFDGSVEFGEGVTPTEAAKAFYNEVGRHLREGCKETK